MHLVKLIELVTGLCLILNVYVPLALLVFAPVMVNIVGLGFTLMPGGLKTSLPMAVAVIFIMSRRRSAYRALLSR